MQTGTPTVQAAVTTPHCREDAASAASEPQQEPELPKVKDLSELSPRATPPELTSNISAMRDLANLSARSAIDTHSRKKMRSVVYSKLIVSFVGLAAAAGLIWMSASGGKVAYGGALVSTIIAVIWGLEYLIISGYTLWNRKSPAQKQPAKTEPTHG
jgi:hypothetical protein